MHAWMHGCMHAWMNGWMDNACVLMDGCEPKCAVQCLRLNMGSQAKNKNNFLIVCVGVVDENTGVFAGDLPCCTRFPRASILL